MSILNDLLKKRITFNQAAVQIEQWAAQVVRNLLSDPTVVATTGAVLSDLKQAASDALSLGDSLAGPIIAAEAAAIEGAADAVFKAYFGPAAPIASKATHDSVDRIAAGMTALIHIKVLQYKASMSQATPTVSVTTPPPAIVPPPGNS